MVGQAMADGRTREVMRPPPRRPWECVVPMCVVSVCMVSVPDSVSAVRLLRLPEFGMSPRRRFWMAIHVLDARHTAVEGLAALTIFVNRDLTTHLRL